MAPDATINLTSLLDIVFNLLLVFMLMAPALKHGITVDLPRTGGEAMNSEAGEPVWVVIAYEEGETEPRIYIDDERVGMPQLQTSLNARVQADPEVAVFIRPSRVAPTETTLQVLNAVVTAGVTRYGFETEDAGEPAAEPSAG